MDTSTETARPDESRTRERDMLMLRAVYGSALVAWPVSFLINESPPLRIVSVGVTLFSIVALLLVGQGRLRIPRYGAAAVSLLAIVAISWSGSGVFSDSVIGYPIVLLIAVSFHGRRSILVYQPAIIGLLVLTFHLQTIDVIESELTPFISWGNVANLSVVFTVFALVLWAVMTILERNAAQAIESEALYRLLAENVHDVVFTTDLEFNTQYCSPSVLEQRGVTAEEFVAGRFARRVPPESAELLRAALAEELARESEPDIDPDRVTALEYEVFCADGSRKWVESVTRFLRDANGKPSGVLGVTRDIDERKRAELARQQLETEMQAMQKLESLGILAGGIAHDFNNLLMGIMGNIDLALHKSPADEVIRENLEQSLLAAQRAADLCRQLLAYSGHGSFVVQRTELKEAVDEMLGLLQASVSKNTSLRTMIGPDAPAIDADTTQIKQIIMNLVINASDALEDKPGSVTIAVGGQEISETQLEGLHGNPEIRPGLFAYLEVSDTGLGMDEGTQSRMFDPFFTTKHGGHGLGLSAVLGIMRGHGGAMRVYSEPGQGTRVRLYFPAAEGEAVKPERRSTAPPRLNRGGLVLVVDDEESVRTLVQDALETAGYRTLAAENGEQAVSIFRDRCDEIDAVLMDLTMPVMNGKDAFREVLRIDPTARVVLASGFSEYDVTKGLGDQKPAGFLQKPYLVDDLLDAMNDALGSDSSAT